MSLRSPTVTDSSRDTQYTDAWIILAILLTLVGIALSNGLLTTAALFVLLLLAFTRLWARFSTTGLTYQRHFSERRAFLDETIELRLEVHNRKLLPVTWLQVTDYFPPELPMGTSHLATDPVTNRIAFSTFWMVGPRQQISRTFTVHCTTRGFHRYGPAKLETGDPFGFFNRQSETAQAEYLIIYPRIYPVTELALPRKNPFGQLLARSSLFEDPLRTAGIRAYNAQDDLRRVHWKATARQQEMLSRVYEASEEPVIQLFLNVATLERHWHGYIPELHERSVSVAASLAMLAAEARIPVGLMANGALPGSDQPLRLLPGRSPDQIVQILELLAAVSPFATQPVEELLAREAPRLPWGASIVLITAVHHPDLLAVLYNLAASGRRVLLFSLDANPPQEWPNNVQIYHLPHLVDDLIDPVPVTFTAVAGTAKR
jgi:uncharacterized protein (DUF58 family)